MKALRIAALVGLTWILSACGNGSTSYSLLADGNSFRQNTGEQNSKIDVLWVVDISGSMQTSQDNLAANFPAFIEKFTEKRLDFQMAVTTTDAYLALPTWTSYYNLTPTPTYYQGQPQEWVAQFKDGTLDDPSGFPILTSSTPDLHNKFIQNVSQGVLGRGDERSLQSMRTALELPANSSFVRPGGFLAVIILTDEDDFSHDGTAMYERYDRPLHTIESYVSFLDELTGSSGKERRYTVNTISVPDQDCLDSIYNGAQKIGTRVMQLAEATGGIKGNICGDFADELKLISDSIVELSTQFYLGNKKPIPSTIHVYVDSVEYPQVSANPAGDGGWYYNADANSIVFQGVYVPPQGAAINVTFDPEELTF